jgi:hypothetical protein
VVAIDDVADRKADALLSKETQLIRRGTGGNPRFICAYYRRKSAD